MSQHTVFTSQEPCWKCRAPLLRLEPPMHGWGYYCKACKHLTSPEAQLHAQLDALPDEPGDPIGVVCAYPLHLEIVQEEPPF